VFTELLKLNVPVKYWRTKAGAEVDFAVRSGKETIPIEAKLKPGALPSGLASFIGHHRPARALVVCAGGQEATRRINGCRVATIPVRQLAREISGGTE